MSHSKLLYSAIAGLTVLGVTSQAQALEHKGSDSSKTVECQGGNMCKGQGSCGGQDDKGESYSCAGNNACKGKGFVMTKSQEECDKLKAKVKASAGKKTKKS